VVWDQGELFRIEETKKTPSEGSKVCLGCISILLNREAVDFTFGFFCFSILVFATIIVQNSFQLGDLQLSVLNPKKPR
jgi:hypothetical protein